MPANSVKLNISIYKNRDNAIDIVPGMITMKSDRIMSLAPFTQINQDLDPECYSYWADIGDDRHIGFNSIEELAELLFNNSDMINKADKNRKIAPSSFSFFRSDTTKPLAQSC